MEEEVDIQVQPMPETIKFPLASSVINQWVIVFTLHTQSWLTYDLIKKYWLPTHARFKDAAMNMLHKCLLILIFILMALGLESYNFSL